MSPLEKEVRKMVDKVDGWGDRKEGFIKEIMEICIHYAAFLQINSIKVFKALEKKRTYSYPNYYQWAKFPKLDKNVDVFESAEEYRNKIKPDKGFRCPSCGGISYSESICDSGIIQKNGKACDWKSFGLFRTMNRGHRFMITEDWLNNATVYETFMPIALENPELLNERASHDKK